MAHKNQGFSRPRSLIKTCISFGIIIASVLLASPLEQVHAYDNYDDCVFVATGDRARMNGNRELTDAEINEIETNCHRSFPSVSPRPAGSRRPAASANPASSSRAATTVDSSAAPATSQAPTVSAPPNTAVSTSPAPATSNNASTSRSSNQSGTSGGADNRPIFDRIVPPRNTDVLTPGFATQDNPSIGSLVNYLFDLLVRRLLPLIAGVLVIVITWGGYQYMMAQGDSGKAKQAKDTILFGIVGLGLALAALSIVSILNNLLLQS